MAATLKTSKNYRSWKNEDSFDQSDVARLFDAEKVKTTKSVNCWKYWSIYCTLIGFFILFFLGILIGFLLRVDSKISSCSDKEKRADGFDRDKLQAVHNNIVFFLSEENIAKYSRQIMAGIMAEKTTQQSDNYVELSSLGSSSTSVRSDKLSAEYVARKFKQFGFDKVEIKEHEIVVTSPDPLHPNRLEIMAADGSTKRNYTFNGSLETKGSNFDKSEPQEMQLDFSPAGTAKGPLMYGNYGRNVDFLQLEASKLVVHGSVVLLKIGHNSVAEKVKLAERHGCVGVLLFCHHSDPCNYGNSSGHFVGNVRDLKDLNNDGLPTIPVLTLSHTVAMDLVEVIPNTSLPTPWQGHKPKYGSKIHEIETVPVNVHLQVNNKESTRTIYNVIATIYGSSEPDRQILLGSRHNVDQSGDNNLDPETNTGTLLELARSIAYIKEWELWKPRRTIKFMSFGGQIKDIGMYHYIKSNKHIVSQEAVTYIDLDPATQGSKVMEFKSSPSVADLLFRASDMIPDPLNPEFSLVERWPKLSHDWYSSNESVINMYRSGEFPLFHGLGIPSITLFSSQSVNTELRRETTKYNSYQLASARVVSLTTLKLLDDLIIPVNTSFMLQSINNSIYHSVEVLQQHLPDPDLNTENLFTILNQLYQLGYNISQHDQDCSVIREKNDFLMRFESVFMDDSFRESLLSVGIQSGSLSAFTEVEDTFLLHKNRDKVSVFLRRIEDVLNEAIKEIHTLKGR